jgi:hypothetical protein
MTYKLDGKRASTSILLGTRTSTFYISQLSRPASVSLALPVWRPFVHDSEQTSSPRRPPV